MNVTNHLTGGTSGAVVASRLANQSPNIEVLLLEGGGDNSDVSHRSPETRFLLPFVQPDLNWPYKSTPQHHLNNRVISCTRGRGLGGSSAINFACWLVGHKEDFNEWAERVDDPTWKWEGENGVEKRFRKIENLQYEGDETRNKYLDEKALNFHSNEGKVNLSYGQQLAEHDKIIFEAAKEFRVGLSPSNSKLENNKI